VCTIEGEVWFGGACALGNDRPTGVGEVGTTTTRLWLTTVRFERRRRVRGCDKDNNEVVELLR
jgi:hypothetical protein